jgi:dTDP-4-dehydrorhamnose 3,5-epimerase
MNYVKTSIDGLFIVNSNIFQDNRGSFSRLFCSDKLREIIGTRTIAQINLSVTEKIGSIRGMHFQNSPRSEMKIVRCLKGRVYDVAVDLRTESKTFLKWHSIELSPHNNLAYVIPEGCAHGFQSLEQSSQLLYLHTNFYSPEEEGAVRFNDPLLDIKWPLDPTDISGKDLNHPLLTPNFKGIKP